MMGMQRLPRWHYRVQKMKKERRNIKVTQQSVFCDIEFHMINPGRSFSCYCCQGLMRGHSLTGYSQCFIICMNRTVKSQEEPTTKEGNEEWRHLLPVSVPG